MTVPLTRRRAMVLASSLLLSPAAALGEGLPIATDGVEDKPFDELTFPELAEVLANWELYANRSNHGSTWEKFSYVTGIQYSASVIAFVGVGTLEQCTTELESLLAWHRHEGYDVYGWACGRDQRSWVVLAGGTLSDGLIAALPKPHIAEVVPIEYVGRLRSPETTRRVH